MVSKAKSGGTTPFTRQPGIAKARTMPGIRLLPVTIFVAVLMLSVRVNDIWRGVTSIDVSSLTLNELQAQQPPPPGGRKRGQASPTPLSTAASSNAAAAPSPSASPSPASPTTSSAPSPSMPSASASEGEPPTFTQNEVDVLQKLSERREALDARQHDLDLRENMIKAAEGRIDKKIAEMKSLQANVESMLKQVDDQDDGKMKSLVKIYENMKPKDAARIFEQLDMPILLGVITRMKEQKVAPVMEAMDPSVAKTLTDAIAMRRGTKVEGRSGG
jgi:flagellar motility protein MotE (MotC chaperone)